MEEYHAIDRRQRERYKELEEINCADMLKTANVQIKVMNQLLDRLIPSDDSHTVITEGKNYSIEVIPQNLMSFRVPCKNANSPAKFRITFDDTANDTETGEEVKTSHAIMSRGHPAKQNKDSLVNKDLRIFISQEEKEPREEHCDRSYF